MNYFQELRVLFLVNVYCLMLCFLTLPVCELALSPLHSVFERMGFTVVTENETQCQVPIGWVGEEDKRGLIACQCIYKTSWGMEGIMGKMSWSKTRAMLREMQTVGLHVPSFCQ